MPARTSSRPVERRASEREASPLFGPQRLRDRQTGLHSPVELETNALLLLGVGIALAGAATIALLLRAERRSHERGEPTLRALGYTSRQLGAVALLRTAPVAIGGAVTAIVLAVGLSPRFPVGIGRQLELDGGLAVDAAVVGVGGALIVFLVGAFSYLLAQARPRRGPPRPRRTLASRLAGAGGPTEVVIGAQLAFGGGSGPGLRNRAAVSSVVPLPSPSSPASASTSQESTTCTPYPLRAGGHGTPSSGTPTSISPRRPSTSSPATLGSRPRRLHGSAARRSATRRPVFWPCDQGERRHRYSDRAASRLGERNRARGPACSRPRRGRGRSRRVLGRGRRVQGGQDGERDRSDRCRDRISPPIFGDSDLGDGAVVTLDVVAAAGGDDQPQFVMAKFGGDDVGADGTSVDRDVTEEMVTDAIPAEVVNLHRVRDLPLIGLLLAGAMGTIILAYTLAVGQRGQMRDLAVLRTVGLTAPQLRRVMAWQGVVLAGAMVLVGLPVGVAVGASLWRRFADDLGVDAGPITPWLLLLAPLCVAVAIVATLHPARRARRATVSTLLRSE